MIPRPEHPKPQFCRADWINLNGKWSFEIDQGRSGTARGLQKADAKLSSVITVPFCPESVLSGIGNVDFMFGLWYQRTVTLTEQQCAGRVFLHFGAVDHSCTVYINGKQAGTHKGGYVSFKFEITDYVSAGENVITVFAEDDSRDPMLPSGKQSAPYASRGCYYTRTTGIWQTVWLEFTPKAYIKSVKYDTNIDTAQLFLTARVAGSGDFAARAFYEGKEVGSVCAKNVSGQFTVTMDLQEKHLWEVGNGRLYDLELTFGEDKVQSYFGLRSLELSSYRFLINGKSVFQRLILDQGFYPDGIYTAPTDEALQKDIELSMAMGFNGARLHEKIFEERFLYHCDRKGYIVWGEYPNWGLDHSKPESVFGILPEWLEEVQRDYNHPAIVGWCPFNETWDKLNHRQCDDVLRTVYLATKAADPYRPCIDTSGNYHVVTDIYDVHDYEQDPAVFKANYDKLMTEGFLFDKVNQRHPQPRQFYKGGPAFVSEYGGIRWAAGENDTSKCSSWGYGKDVEGAEDFLRRYKGLADALLDNSCMFGLCYTQLTDVEQEQNGLYTYDRKPKFPPEVLRPMMARKAAIED